MSNPAASSSSSASASEEALPPVAGWDTEGNEYATVDDMWQAELGVSADPYDAEKGWYGKAITYWGNTPATNSGVLGGLDHTNDCDLKESAEFIASLPPTVGRTRALDCGAGIGRISKALLMPLFEKVDILEPLAHMVAQAQKELDPAKLGRVFLTSMEKAELPTAEYDLIVIQWAAMYLTDAHFIAFLQQCRRALRPGGVVYVKENNANEGVFHVDKSDSSLTRSDSHHRRIFEAAGLRVAFEAKQKDWPDELCDVRMYGLVPASV